MRRRERDRRGAAPVVRVEVPDTGRDERVRMRLEDVRRRLETGELDSELALVETALALLDGDLPGV